jgi:hypothetical protein
VALLRAGHTDLNTEHPALVEAAGRMLASLVDPVNVKVGITGYLHRHVTPAHGRPGHHVREKQAGLA